MADSSNKAGAAQPLAGFEFLQDMFKNAGAALPHLGPWVAPTLDPKELDKRIEELRTVQFWLEQNTRMIGATIQGLEVQRMTLSTLQTMNVQMGDLRESMKLRDAAPPAPDATASASARTPPAAGAVDPMQWWDALTQQFAQLAAGATKPDPVTAAGSPGRPAKAPKAAKAKPRPASDVVRPRRKTSR